MSPDTLLQRGDNGGPPDHVRGALACPQPGAGVLPMSPGTPERPASRAPQRMPPPSSHRRSLLVAAASGASLTACASRPPPLAQSLAVEQVRAAEVSFAATMARRDLSAFAGHIAEDAVFINGGQPLRGKPAILEFWSQYFKSPAPPFAWRPDIVEVSAQASLGYTEGPVTAGQAVIARFYSTWQLQPGVGWRVIFDNGYAQCAR